MLLSGCGGGDSVSRFTGTRKSLTATKMQRGQDGVIMPRLVESKHHWFSRGSCSGRVDHRRRPDSSVDTNIAFQVVGCCLYHILTRPETILKDVRCQSGVVRSVHRGVAHISENVAAMINDVLRY